MKQPPELDAIQRRMEPGVITRDGFLGDDRRTLLEIIDEDGHLVLSLGLTHDRIADRLYEITEAGRKGLGTSVNVDDSLDVRVQEWRGSLPCPWQHQGVYRKSITEVEQTESGEQMQWTSLSIHMIRKHGFYGGKGSRYRVDPRRASEILGL